jgi:hypothetical protein
MISDVFKNSGEFQYSLIVQDIIQNSSENFFSIGTLSLTILNRPLSLVHRTDAVCERGLQAAQEQDAKPTSGGRLPTRQQLAPEGALGEISYMKPSTEEGLEILQWWSTTHYSLPPEGCQRGISGVSGGRLPSTACPLRVVKEAFQA